MTFMTLVILEVSIVQHLYFLTSYDIYDIHYGYDIYDISYAGSFYSPAFIFSYQL